LTDGPGLMARVGRHKAAQIEGGCKFLCQSAL
jgi:hypothetical protein